MVFSVLWSVADRANIFRSLPHLLLRTAVVVQPLTPEQIETYLASGGERLDALRESLREDSDLRALASTPLMLNVLTAACQGTPLQEITTTGSFGMKQDQVFASYVQRMLTRRNTGTRYKSTANHSLAQLPGRPDEAAESNRLLSRADATRLDLWH